jgi:hypothetical protein
MFRAEALTTASRFYGLLGALLFMVGCSHNSYNLGAELCECDLPDPDQALALGDVLALLGPPLRLSATPTGYVLAWEHWDISEAKLGFSLGVAGADAVSVNWGKARVRGEFLLLGFNFEHQLSDATFTEWDNVSGGGQAIQPLGGLIPVVDVDDLLKPMPQHRWGALSLGELPATLNADNRPDTGQNGVEQRGTPTNMGQRSLEMD